MGRVIFAPRFVMDTHTDIPPEILQIKSRIATVCAQREQFKLALETGALAPGKGLAQLELLDQELSGLDTRFKFWWDEQARSARGEAV